jgi:hypothetical protein
LAVFRAFVLGVDFSATARGGLLLGSGDAVGAGWAGAGWAGAACAAGGWAGVGCAAGGSGAFATSVGGAAGGGVGFALGTGGATGGGTVSPATEESLDDEPAGDGFAGGGAAAAAGGVAAGGAGAGAAGADCAVAAGGGGAGGAGLGIGAAGGSETEAAESGELALDRGGASLCVDGFGAVPVEPVSATGGAAGSGVAVETGGKLATRLSALSPPLSQAIPPPMRATRITAATAWPRHEAAAGGCSEKA